MRRSKLQNLLRVTTYVSYALGVGVLIWAWSTMGLPHWGLLNTLQILTGVSLVSFCEIQHCLLLRDACTFAATGSFLEHQARLYAIFVR